MSLRAIGAGLPRTGTSSLKNALELLLGGRCCHMSVLPGHPFDLGPGWQTALAGGTPEWDELLEGFVASDDWPASMFFAPLSKVNPDAIVILSTRTSAAEWLQSLEATVLPVARESRKADWTGGRDLLTLFERFTGTTEWDSPEILHAAYNRHNATVRRSIAPERLVDWQAGDGWEPICSALGVAVPDEPFPWVNKREDWG
jgi:hypothetical protein